MSSINSYLSFIGPIAPLSREEKELIIKAQKGNEAARTKLIKANILYVSKVVKHYSHLDDIEELMACGCMGLNTAISNFKVESGYKLITYANWCIRTAILEQTKTKSVECKTSLDESLSSNSENTLLDTIESGTWSNPEEKYIAAELHKNLEAFLSTLSQRDATIIKAHSGYDYENPLSLTEIGNIVGLSKGGVHEAEKKIRKQVLSNQNNKTLADYLAA